MVVNKSSGETIIPMFYSLMKKYSFPLLLSCNIILIALGWVMALYTFPRLPSDIPLWPVFSGQTILWGSKSFLFFIYPAAQTLFSLIFGLAAHIILKKKNRTPPLSLMRPEKRIDHLNLGREHTVLALIFFNLIFIHIQRCLILMAHGIEKGCRPVHLFSFVAVLLMLIPMFRLRRKMISDQ